MAKDPAFLFYYQDFLVGTEFLTAEEVGCYIRILCHLADKGSLSLKHMQSICKGYAFTEDFKSKFLVDKDGLYYHKRLAFEVQKRKDYTESRRNNAKAYAKHMENENENENVIKDKIFRKPTLDQVIKYCKEINSKVDPELFFNNYESSGWIKANGQKVKNWKATIKTWEKRPQFDKTKEVINKRGHEEWVVPEYMKGER